MASNAKQLGFDLGDRRVRTNRAPDVEEVREDLRAMLAEARRVSAEAPWDERTYRYNKVVFPQMANWLPEEEAERLRFEFAKELERIARLRGA